MKNILIVDDEIEIIELLKVYLENNFTVFEAYNGEMALKVLYNNPIDIVILDIMLPKMDGFQLIRKIREYCNLPVIFLSAMGKDMNKIYGLELGADDYISKPFNPLEVIARVKALLRRYHTFNSIDEKCIKTSIDIKFGDLCINKDSCEIFKGSEKIDLTSIEYKLLLYLAENPNRVFTKQQIYEAVWGAEYLGDENIIMVYMSKLREKIESDPKNPIYLKTIRGLGYRFERRTKNER